RAPKVVDGLLPVAHGTEKAGLEREAAGAVGAERACRPLACLGEEEGELQLEDVGVLELVEQERADAGLLPRAEPRVGREEITRADEQLGEVQDARLVERGPLAPRELDEQPAPGLLVRAGQHERRRSEGRVASAERVPGGPDGGAEAVLPAPARQGIAQVREPRRPVERGVE